LTASTDTVHNRIRRLDLTTQKMDTLQLSNQRNPGGQQHSQFSAWRCRPLRKQHLCGRNWR